MSRTLTLVALGMMLVIASGDVSAQNPTLRTAMRDKLVDAQRLLQAVVAGDYVAMGRSADALSRISETEIASWQAPAQPEYVKQATSFLLSVQGVRDAAAKRSIDAALTEYTALVSSCTRCHALVRSSQPIAFRQRAHIPGELWIVVGK